jgi:hypothetical protein
MEEALEFAKGAIMDAIKLEDGLDGAAGQAVVGMIDAALQKSHDSAGEYGWLIERDMLCLGFCEHKFTWVTFTNEDALRFSRQRDAYSFMETAKWKPFNLHLEGASVTEQRWGL